MVQRPSLRRSLTRAIVPALAAAAVAGAGALALVSFDRGPHGEIPQGCVLPPPPNIGGPIRLVDGAGRPVTQERFAGKPTLVYFGFTHCPDVCPTTMYAVGEAIAALGARGRDVQTALISVDPERDNPETMAAYVASNGFPPGLVGLTGAADQVAAAERAFKVTALRSPTPDGGYSVDHTSFLYIMDPLWRLAGVMTTVGKTPQEIAQCVRHALPDMGG